MATAVETPQTQFLMLDLAKITPSPMNPRKRFDDKSLKELAESIVVHGVQQPIVVRPNGKEAHYEIVVGERRFRASKLAGAKQIPAIVRELNDAAALEIMVIENLQRADVHPLDEALGYEALMKKYVGCPSCHTLGTTPDSHSEGCPDRDKPHQPATADSIAAKVGKSVGYVYARLKLLALIPATREAFEKNYITPGHAVLIARLQPIDQVRALKACFHFHIDDREIRKIEDPKKLKLEDVVDDIAESRLIPEKGLREWIQDNINLRLKDVPWDLGDAKLLPQAGACITCPKRSTSNPNLFGELAVKGEDTCFDAACFQAKRSAFVKLTIKQDKEAVKVTSVDAAKKEINVEPKQPMLQLSDLSAYTKAKPDQAVYRRGQWLPAKAGSCPNVRKGIMVRGEEAGITKLVCIDPSCRVHKHDLHSASSSSGSGQRTDYEEQSFQNHRERIRERKKTHIRAVLCKAIVDQIDAKMPIEMLREVAAELLERRDQDYVSWLIGEKKPLGEKELVAHIKKAGVADLNCMIAAMTLSNGILTSWNVNEKELRESTSELAKAIGVRNPAKVLADAEKAMASAKQCRACGCTEQVPCDLWKGGKRIACCWTEDDLCSNPECKKHDDKVKAKAKGKAASAK